MPFTFQLLVIDPKEAVACQDVLSLLHLLRGCSALWTKATLSETNLSINDGKNSLTVEIVEDPGESDNQPQSDLGIAFVITLSGDYAGIESLREPLVEFIKSHEFKSVYVLRDEVSEQIACKLYPHLYRIENLLRGYLIRFMATRIGPLWWDMTASSELTQKANMRKKNELVFGKYIENSAYLIDFGELGELVYRYSSGFRTREEIVSKIEKLDETPAAIRALKSELKSNYHKLFQQSFADKKFKEKWQDFEVLRNKIAHNNLFTAGDLVKGETLATEISEIIISAGAKASHVFLTPEEKESIQEQVLLQGAPSISISVEDFLEEMDGKLTYWQHKAGGFLGLKQFMRYLGSKGYSEQSCSEALRRLQEVGIVETHQVPNPKDKDWPTTGLRRLV